MRSSVVDNRIKKGHLTCPSLPKAPVAQVSGRHSKWATYLGMENRQIHRHNDRANEENSEAWLSQRLGSSPALLPEKDCNTGSTRTRAKARDRLDYREPCGRRGSRRFSVKENEIWTAIGHQSKNRIKVPKVKAI